MNAADALQAQFGARVAALLATPEQQQAAHRTFRLIADVEGEAIARAWMIGMNPHLNDRAPLLAIRDGHGKDAEVAARAYLNGGGAR
jgi:hypothetical protein